MAPRSTPLRAGTAAALWKTDITLGGHVTPLAFCSLVAALFVAACFGTPTNFDGVYNVAIERTSTSAPSPATRAPATNLRVTIDNSTGTRSGGATTTIRRLDGTLLCSSA